MEESSAKIERLEGLSETDLKELAAYIGGQFKSGLILLIGELGAGKTTFVRGLARAYGIDEREIRSPTFVIMNVYEGIVTLYHIDLYRLESEEELFYIGIDDVLDEESVVAVEWADLFPKLWDDVERIEVKISIRERNSRDVEIIDRTKEGLIGESIKRWKDEKSG